MQEGHKRLKEAFEKTRTDSVVQQEVNKIRIRGSLS